MLYGVHRYTTRRPKTAGIMLKDLASDLYNVKHRKMQKYGFNDYLIEGDF